MSGWVGALRWCSAFLFALAAPLPRCPAAPLGYSPAAPLGYSPAAPLHAQQSLTIYNDGRVLARRTLALAVPKGTSEHKLELGALDPATLMALDSGIVIAGARYDGAVDEASVMRRSLGRTIGFRTEKGDTLSATVIGVDPERFRLPDGRVLFARPGLPLYPGEVVTGAIVALTLRSDAARKQLRLGYFTGGARWQAGYQAVLGRGSARVTGSAVVTSEWLRADDAELQLLAGAVSRAVPEPKPPIPLAGRARALQMGEEVAPGEERVGEFHLYSLPGRATLLPGTSTSVALFDPAAVPFERAYVVRGEVPFYGMVPRQGEEGEVPVEVTYTLKRPRKSDFGDRPLPAGVLRLFQADSAGRLQLVGESLVKHTAAGEDVRASAGTAFDLTARRVQISYSTRRDSTRAGVRIEVTADYAVTLTNATDSAATIEVREQRAGEWSVVSSSVPAEKVSSTTTRFRVAVPPGGRTVLTYRIRAIS